MDIRCFASRPFYAAWHACQRRRGSRRHGAEHRARGGRRRGRHGAGGGRGLGDAHGGAAGGGSGAMRMTWRRVVSGGLCIALAAAAGWAKADKANPKGGMTVAGTVHSVTATDLSITHPSGTTVVFTLGEGTSYDLLTSVDATSLKAGDDALLVGSASVLPGQTLTTFKAHAVVLTGGANSSAIHGAVALLPPG